MGQQSLMATEQAQSGAPVDAIRSPLVREGRSDLGMAATPRALGQWGIVSEHILLERGADVC